MSELAKNLEAVGRALVAWLGPVNAWTAVLLVGALALDRALSRHARASLRIALYAPIALRVVLPLGWTIPLAHAPRVVSLLTPLPDVGPAPLPELPAAHLFTWQAALAIAYVAVAALLGARAIVARVRLGRAVAGATPLDAREGCDVALHDALGPMVVGLVAPRIVLPRRLVEEGTAHAIECVLRHEIAHIRRGDAWLSATMQLFAAVAWPVVPVWIAIARVRQLVELACDEAAVAGADAGERRKYGHALLDMAEWRSLTVTALGAGELHFGSTLRARIEALASQRHWPRAAQVGLVVAVAAGFAACSSVSPSSDAVATSKPAGARLATGTPLPTPAESVTVNGVVFRGDEDIRAHCPTFVARVRAAPDDFDWVHGSTEGIPADEVALCRDPQITGVVLLRAWSDEARHAMAAIARAATAAYRRDPATGNGPAKLCPSGAPEPAELQARGARYRPTAESWKSPGWMCLRFAMNQPFWFQYGYTSDATSFTITAHAQHPKGDRAVDVTMVLRGHILDSGIIEVAPNIEETWREVP